MNNAWSLTHVHTRCADADTEAVLCARTVWSKSIRTCTVTSNSMYTFSLCFIGLQFIMKLSQTYILDFVYWVKRLAERNFIRRLIFAKHQSQFPVKGSKVDGCHHAP